MITSFDPYVVLGLEKRAQLADIKKAYHKLALENHPDKLGHSDAATQALAAEKTKMITQAYKILTDAKERQEWEDSQNCLVTEHLQISTTPEGLSASYKRYFENAKKIFQTSPLQRLTKADLDKTFTELKLFGTEYHHLYRVNEDSVEYSDIYRYITHLENVSTQRTPLETHFFTGHLNPTKAIDLLLGFLQGKYYGQNLKLIQNYFQMETARLYQLKNPLLTFYQSIETIFNVTSIEQDFQKVLNALEGIYAFPYQKSKRDINEIDIPNVIRLMQDRYFRYLVTNAHRYFWVNGKPIITLSLFTETKTEYAKGTPFSTPAESAARNERSEDEESSEEDERSEKAENNINIKPRRVDTVRKSILYIESQMLNTFSTEKNITDIYDRAYLLIDLSDCHIPISHMINSLILAGLEFQFAASQETEQSSAMAAEHLALSLYQRAMGLSYLFDTTLTLYASTQVAKYVSEFIYNQTTLSRAHIAKSLTHSGDTARLSINTDSVVDTLKSAVKKSLYLIDIFPFYTSLKSTIDLSYIREYQRSLIRSLEKSLLIQECLPSYYDYTKLVYLAYQDVIIKRCETPAEEEARAIQEINLKSQAIDLLLKRENSNSDDMVKLIDHPFIHMKRDTDGWFVPKGELDFPDAANITIYKSFDGYEVDYTTGKINLFLKEWQEGDSRSLRLFTDYDITQMFGLGIAGGNVNLSLDPQLKYHPLQILSFEPSLLKGTEYLKTLFMVDYLLKMFTTGNEVSANFPYLTRKINKLLSLLPVHLREILNRYSESDKKNSHRFWITTKEIERQSTVMGPNHVKVYYGNVNVIMQKHLLQLGLDRKDEDTVVDNDNNSPAAQFVEGMTQFYDEISDYFPEFRRLKELVKIAGAISELKMNCKQYRETIDPSALLEGDTKWIDGVYTRQFKKHALELITLFQSVSPRIQQAHPLSDVDWWNAALDKDIAQVKDELQAICAKFKKFSYQLNDPEIVQAYNERYRKKYDEMYLWRFDIAYQARKENFESFFGVQKWQEQEAQIVAQLKTRVSQELTEYLSKIFPQQEVLDEFNRKGDDRYKKYQQFYYDHHISLRETLGETAYSTCINAFLAVDCLPLARAIATYEQEQLKSAYLKKSKHYFKLFCKQLSLSEGDIKLNEVDLKKAIEKFLSGKVESLAGAFARNYVIELEKKTREEKLQLGDDSPKILSSNVRVPSLFSHRDRKLVYGGVLAYPKFCQRVAGSHPSFFTPSSFNRNQVSRDSRSLISNFYANPHVMRQTPASSTPSLRQDPFASFRTRESARVARPVGPVTPVAAPAAQSSVRKNLNTAVVKREPVRVDTHRMADLAHGVAHTLGAINQGAHATGLHLSRALHRLEAAAEVSAAILHETNGQRANDPSVAFENVACGTLSGAAQAVATAVEVRFGAKVGSINVSGSAVTQAVARTAIGMELQEATSRATAPVANAVNRACHATFFIAGQLPENESRAIADGLVAVEKNHY